MLYTLCQNWKIMFVSLKRRQNKKNNWIELYSALRKYSYPFVFSRFVAALRKTALNYFFPTPIYTPYTIIAKQKKKFFSIFANV